MTLANEADAGLRHADRFFIGGEWVTPSSNSRIDVIDSGTEEVFLSVAEAQAEDIARSVAAAREAFDQGPWPRMTHAERAGYLRAIGGTLRERGSEVAQLWPRESGVLYTIAQSAGADEAETFNYYAGLAGSFPFEEPVQVAAPGEFGLIVREPVGVVGAIVPWNAPLTVISYKIAPALLAGCTVVLKSSPEAPWEGYLIAEAAEAAGLPPGVLNVVLGLGPDVGTAIVAHPLVRKVAFTGSVRVGQEIGRIAADRILPLTLELGGKSANIVFADADLDFAATEAVRAYATNAGQVCSSGTRLLVQRPVQDRFVDAVVTATRRLRPGRDVGPFPAPMGERVDELHRFDEVRGDAAAHQLALAQGLAHQPEFELFEVAQPAVKEFGRAAGRPGGEVACFEQGDRQPASGGV